MSSVSSGQPRVAKGHRPLLSQVSRTSVSWVRVAAAQWAHFVGSSRDTVIFEHVEQCHAGTRWPHQSWREMHQSRMFSIQLRYVFSQFSGTNSRRLGVSFT